MLLLPTQREMETAMASIKKISERKYKITVSNGYRAGGKKIARAKTITIPSDVPARSIAQYIAHAAEEMERMMKRGYTEDGEMTFEEYAERWLSRQVKYAPSTLESYRRMLQVIYSYIGGIKLNRLRPIALENMMIELRKQTCRGRQIQEATVRKYLTVASAVLSDAKRNEIIPKNPAHMVELPAVESLEQAIPTSAQMELLISALAQEPQPYRMYYLLALHTGLRRGELCALKWSDLRMHEDNAIITVSRSRTSVAGHGIQEGQTKNRKKRTVVADAQITTELTAYAKERNAKPDNYLFTAPGGAIHPDTFTKRLKRLYARIGLPESFHLHTLRHFYVTVLLHRGVDKRTVADLVGHSDTSFLERVYCHPQLESKERAAKVFGESVTRRNGS